MQIFQRIYEGIMLLLVLLTIMSLWTEDGFNSTINWVVWFIFFVDFIIRFILAGEKLVFLKKNPFLIIAIIPFDQFFQVARIVRVIYLFRIKTITKYYIQPFVNKLTYQSKILIILVVLALLVGESIIIWFVESEVASVWLALQYVFTHILVFGDNTYNASHPVTIWCFTITSVFGIVLQGLAIQWLFAKVEGKWKRRNVVSTNKDVNI